MIAVRMVQVPVDQVIDVIPVWDRLMAAPRAVLMAGVMSGARVRRAGGRIRCRHFQHALVVVPFVRLMKMAVVQVVDVISMLDRGVTTTGTMLMRMILMYVMRHESMTPFASCQVRRTEPAALRSHGRAR